MNENRKDELLTAAQAVKLIPFTNKAQLLRWGRTGKIPVVRLPSNRVLFRRSDIEAILNPVVISEEPDLSIDTSTDVPLPGLGVV